MLVFTDDYIKKLIDEAGKRAIKSLSVGADRFDIQFYPTAMDTVEPAVKSTVAVPGGPLGLGIHDEDELSPDTVQFPGPGVPGNKK